MAALRFDDEPEPGPPLLSLQPNQDGSAVAVGTRDGFRLLHTSPVREVLRRTLPGGVAVVAPLHRTNLLALVGGGRLPFAARTRVTLWDDARQQPLAAIDCAGEVRAVVSVYEACCR